MDTYKDFILKLIDNSGVIKLTKEINCYAHVQGFPIVRCKTLLIYILTRFFMCELTI